LQVDSVSSLLNQIPLINFLFLGANTYFMLNIKLAISNLKTEISKDRMQDAKEMREWVEKEISAHTINCKVKLTGNN
jgi:hypothetical protein